MSKKKHAEHVNHERWLVSYADLLTLLFAFFVVLFASSVSDKKKAAKMAAAMQTAFQQHGVFDAHSATPPLEDSGGSSQGAPAPLMLPVQVADAARGDAGSGTGSAAELAKAVQSAVTASGLRSSSVSIHQSAEGVTISLREAGFFSSGSAEMNPAMLPLLDRIARTLPDRDLRVEGHTDNIPMHSARFQSNWELSTARAAAIGQVLITRSRIAPSHLSLAGYGPFRPTQSNATEQGRAANRRVDIVLLGDAVGAPGSMDRAAQLQASGSEETSAPKGGTALRQQLATDADRAAAR